MLKILVPLFIILAVFSVVYFSEVDRSILLFVVYPFIGFLGIGLAAIYERR